MAVPDILSTEPDCAFNFASDVLSKKWVINIALELITSEGDSLAFSDISERIPEISPRMLSIRLKDLLEFGIIIELIPDPEKPKKKRYRLSESGLHLAHVLKELRSWSLRFGTCDNEKCQANQCKHGMAINRLVELELSGSN